MSRRLPLAAALVAVTGVVASAAAPPAPAQSGPCPLAALAPLRPEGVEQRVVVGQPSPCPPPGTPGDYAIRIDFGDGTVADSAFDPNDAMWFVGGRHTYRRAGVYDVVATVTHRVTGAQLGVFRRDAVVANALLSAADTMRATFRAGAERRGVVARFHDANRLATARDYRATVSWGDGSRSRGTVVRDGRAWAVRAAHRYRRAGSGSITVTVRDDTDGRLVLKTIARVLR